MTKRTKTNYHLAPFGLGSVALLSALGCGSSNATNFLEPAGASAGGASTSAGNAGAAGRVNPSGTAGSGPGVGASSSGGTGAGVAGSGVTSGGGVGAGGSGGAMGGAAGFPSHSGLPALHVDGAQLKDPAGNAVVLRGLDTADLAVLDTQRAPMNIAKLLDLMSDAAQGWYARAVRLAVSPGTWNKNPDDYFHSYLEPAVAHATARNLYVIIDWHYVADPAPNAASTLAFWAYVAPKFAAQSNVIFELYNEPIKINGGTKWADWKDLAQPWVDSIRSVAPDNLLLIGGPQWSQNIGGAATDPFDGKNLAYVGHVYPQVAKALWQPGGQIAVAAGARPVVISEWGYIDGGAQPTSGTQSSFGDAFKAWLDQSGVSWTAWCADTSWDPKMFDQGWSLLGGDGYMGEFVKAYLAAKKDDHQAR